MGLDRDLTPEEAATRRSEYTIALLWHLGAFVIINVSFWLLDLAIGQPGAQWAPWIAAIWGVGLLFHVLAWFIDGRRLGDRLTERYLEQQRHGTAH